MEFFALRVTSRVWVRSMALLLLFGGALAGFRVAAIGQQNPIQVENARPGTTAWQLSNPSNESEEGSPIEGYASATSVNRGDQISFFVRTTSPTFTIAIYRLGWYGGLGGRQEMAPVQLSAVAQPLPTPDPTYFSVECNWTSSFTLTTSNPSDPTDWVSGIYVAKLTASSGNDRYIIFVVRDDSRSSSLVYQQSVNTSQAYNAWGGTSLYSSSPRAVKVSFNRPYDDGWGTGLFLSYEFDMVGFLESEGYDVSYTTDVDTHERGNLLTNHKGFLVVGHDEYWSLEMRQNVTAARDAGVGLGFFSADTMYWQIRYEPSPITGVADRTIVGYKETAAQDDPDASNPATYPLITTAFRNVHGDLPGQPEDAVVGIMYNSEEPASGDIIVENTGTWIFTNTGLSDGDHLPGILGYEVDALFNDATTPADIIDVAHSPYVLGGQSFAADSSVYQAASGAWVFATGSVEWDWGLNDISPWGPTSSLVNAATQQITRNVLNQFISGTVITPSPTPSGVPTARPTPGPGGPITERSVATGSTSAAGSQVTIPVPAGAVANDVMVAQVTVRGGSGTTLTAPAGWSLVRRDNDSGGQIAEGIYVHVVTATAEPASYTWTFSAGNDAAGGIADYSGVNTAAPIDVNGGQANASSTSVTAPSVTVPAGHSGDRLLALFAMPDSSAPITLPGAITGRWNFHAIGFGISAAMGDASTPSGATGNYVALQGTSTVNIGALVALQPAGGSATPTPTPTTTPTPTPTPSPTPTPVVTPTPSPSATPTPTPSPTPTPVATPTPTPTATPTPGPGGSITERSIASGSTSAASSQVTIPVPAGAVANDVMVAQVTVRGGSGTTLTAPAGWSLVRRDNDSGGQIAEGIYVHVVTATAEPASYTWTFSAGNDAAGGIADYSGVSTAAPIDVNGGQGNAASTSVTAPSVTVPEGHNADRLLAVFAI